jgi:hypothetical protein
VLRVRRLLVVDQSPDGVEDARADLTGDQAADDADGKEEELHCARKRIPLPENGYAPG